MKQKFERPSTKKPFHLEFKNTTQKIAWMTFSKHDILFLVGPAGTGKSHLATAFAISEILNKKKKKLVITRPTIEAGESIGYLPGSADEKLHPYLLPIYDLIGRMVGDDSLDHEKISRCIEVCPLGFLRGRTFHDAVCILDEAQNATEEQLKLFLTRLGEDSKMIITGDPTQSDLRNSGLRKVVEGLKTVQGIGVIEFNEESIVRHPLVSAILKAWPK